jgi:hypothetical protein
VTVLAVDPEAMFAAGSGVLAAGDGLSAAMTILTAGFGANTGLDIAGEVFGLTYQSTAESLLKLAAAVINACRHNGAQIQVGASNYSKAEAASTLGGGSGVLQAPGDPVKIAAPAPPGTLGPGEPPPLLWAVVQSFVDDVWPNGDVAALHVAAGCWRTFGAAASGMQGALNSSKTLIGTQQMPESGLISQALSRMGDVIGKLGEQCGQMAAALDGFANQVAQAQDNIRNLLHRLESLADVWHGVVSIFDGDALEELKEIARDINAVLHDLGREARAFEQGTQLLMQIADGLVVDVEKFTRGQLTHFLGDAVGNPVATAFDTFVNANEGVVKEAIKTVEGLADLSPQWFLVDPKGAAATWKGTAEGQFKTSFLNEILHPREGVEANVNMWKSLLHLDDWSTARPGMAFGEDAFDVATFFIPGVGEAGAGAEASAAGARAAQGASELAEGAATMGRVGELGDVAATSRALSDIGKASTGLTKDLDGLALNLPKTDVPAGGRPIGTPPVDAPGAPPRPVESAPPGTPAPHSPTAPGGSTTPGRPGAPVLPHEPAPASVPAGGPHDPRQALHGLANDGGGPPGRLPGNGNGLGPNATLGAAAKDMASAHPAPATHPASAPLAAEPHVPPVGHVPSSSYSPHMPAPWESGPHWPGEGTTPANKSDVLEGSGGHNGIGDGGSHSTSPGPFTPDDLSTFAHYTDKGSEDLNDALRRHTVDASQRARVDALNRALEKLPPYEGTVVRGSDIPPEMLARYRPGEVITEYAFLSTSLNPAVARSSAFAGNVEFRIVSLSGRDISSFSKFPAEQEILFRSGTEFYVIDRVVDPVTGRTIIDMIEF